jgi:hypothetical protein
VVAATGAVALEVGVAVDLTGAGNCEVLDTVDLVAPVDEPTGLVAVGLDCVAVTLGDACPAEGAVD